MPLQEIQENQHRLEWKEIARLLSSGASRSRLRIRVVDTVFLDCHESQLGQVKRRHPSPYHQGDLASRSGRSHGIQRPSSITISSWICTNKRGEVIDRVRNSDGAIDDIKPSHCSSRGIPVKNQAVSCSQVYERFARVALADPGNASGPRIVAIKREGIEGQDSTQRLSSLDEEKYCKGVSSCEGGFHLTAEHFKRFINGVDNNSSTNIASSKLLVRCSEIQCYIRPLQGRNRVFRAVYSVDEDSAGRRNGVGSLGRDHPRIDVSILEDGGVLGPSCAASASLGSNIPIELNEEVASATMNIVAHIEFVFGDLLAGKDSSVPQKASAVRSPTTVSAIMSYIVDERHRLWLCRVDSLFFRSSSDFFSKLEPKYVQRNLSWEGSTREPKKAFYAVSPNAESGGDVAGGGEADPQQALPSRHLVETEHSSVLDESERIQAETVAQSLRDRIGELEDELSKTKSRSERSNCANCDRSRRMQKKSSELANAQKQTLRELQQRDGEHMQTVLDLKSQVNSAKAEVARLQLAFAKEAKNSVQFAKKEGSGNVLAKSLEETLIAKIDSLHQELLFAQRKFSEERRALNSSHAASDQERAARYRAAVAEHRVAITDLEDDVVAQKGKTRDEEKEKIVLLQKLSAANEKFAQINEENLNMRNEIDILKQSLQASQEVPLGGRKSCTGKEKCEVGEGVMVDEGSNAVGRIRQEMDSKIQILGNKVDYLNAQLQSEATVKEEYIATIKILQKEKAELVDEHRLEVAELGARNGREIAEITQKFQDAIEKPSEDVSHLEQQVKNLRLQLDETSANMVKARRTEKTAKADAIKVQTLMKKIKEELALAKDKYETASKEIDKFRLSTVDMAANEGMLRRLDNERKLLNNQLLIITASKEELMKKLDETEKIIEENKERARDGAKALEKELKRTLKESEAKEARLKDHSQVLRAEVVIQQAHIEELRQSFVTARDQLRVERVSTEQMRAAGQRMAEELKAAQDELKYLRSATDDAAARHNETTKMISSSIKKEEGFRMQEICRLRDETREAFLQVSRTQTEMINLRSSMRSEQARTWKEASVRHLSAIISHRLRFEGAHAVVTWKLGSHVDLTKQIADNQKTIAISRAVRNSRNDFDRQKAQIWESQTKAVDEMKIKHVEISAHLEEEAKVERDLAVQKERERLELLLRKEEESWVKRTQAIYLSHEAAVAKVRRDNCARLEILQRKADEKLEATVSATEVRLRRGEERSIQECNIKWAKKIEETKEALTQEQVNALKEIEKYLWVKINKANEKETRIQAKRLEAFKQNVETEKKRIEEKHNKSLEQCNRSWSTRLKALEDDHTVLQQSLEEKNIEEMESKALEWESSRSKNEAELRAILKSNYEVHFQAIRDKDRELFEAAALESTKGWEIKMQESRAKYSEEYRSHYEEGKVEAETRLANLLEETETSHRAALKHQLLDSKEAMEKAMEDKESQINRILREAENDKQRAIAETLHAGTVEQGKLLEKTMHEHKNDLKRETKRLSILAEKEAEAAIALVETNYKKETSELRAQLHACERERKDNKDSFESEIKEIRREHEKVMTERLNNVHRAAKEMQALDQQALQVKLDEQCEELTRLHKVELKRAETDALTKLHNEIERVKDEAQSTLRASLQYEAESHKTRLEEVERERSVFVEEHRLVLKKLEFIQMSHAEQQAAVILITSDLKCHQKRAALDMLRYAAALLTQRRALENSIKILESNAVEKLENTRRTATEDKEVLETKLADADEIVRFYISQTRLMHDTLVTENRDALLSQKAKSREISSQLEAINAEHQALDDLYREALGRRQGTEANIRDLETKIQEHAQISTIRGGRVNISHARRKRKLDDNYEELLDRIESHREEIVGIEIKMQEVVGRKGDAEERMNAMERTLVEILVDQQKKLLGIVASGPNNPPIG